MLPNARLDLAASLALAMISAVRESDAAGFRTPMSQISRDTCTST